MRRTTVAVLREQLHEANRRERELLRIIAELNDRLAHAYGQPWTLPPRPAVPDAASDGDGDPLEDLVEI